MSDWSSDVCSSDLPFFDLLDDDPRDVCADHAAAVVTGISEIATHVLVEREIGRMYRRKILARVADDHLNRLVVLQSSKILPRPARMMPTALEGHAIGAVMNSGEQVSLSRITALFRRHSRPLLVD